MTDKYDHKRFPLKDVPAAYAVGWRFDSRPTDLIHDDTPIPMKKPKYERALWASKPNT